MDYQIYSLSGLTLPQDAGVRRDSEVPQAEQSAEFHRLFDAHTLIYDAVRLPGRDRIVITAPAFSGLWPIFKAGLRLDGRPVRGLGGLRRRRYGLRCEQVTLAARPGAALSFAGAGIEAEIPVRASRAAAFAGANLLLTKSKDNDPDWITEWARFHVRRHGADALVLFDNGSTAYGLEDLLDQLRRRSGLTRVHLVRTPFPYGGKFTTESRHYGLSFLQPALLNLARRDMAARARAVLNADVDEMVMRLGSQSLFDAAAKAPRGGIMIGGSWVYPAPESALPCAQHLHRFRADPDARCNRKWAARPQGVFSRLGGWAVHSFGASYLKGWRKRPPHPGFALAHCTGTTTGWKEESVRFRERPKLCADAALAAELAWGRAEPPQAE